MARFRFNFWLDCNKDEELVLAETIDELKAERSFSRTIREGIKLVVSLRECQVDVLEMLFPWIKDHYRKQLTGEDSPVNQEFAAILRQQSVILERLATQPPPVPFQETFQLPELVSVFVDDKPNSMQPVVAVRETFAVSMGDLFADDDDDLFD